MKFDEYKNVEHFSYEQYCKYLQDKYGIGRANYFFASWSKNPKVSRTSEGLFAHHKYENEAIMLSEASYAKDNPIEWQNAENIVYCDFLEHLLLHIFICEESSIKKRTDNVLVGFGGVVNYIVPELNDIYSGWEPKQQWKKNCAEKVIDDIDVYLELVYRFKLFANWFYSPKVYNDKMLCASFGEQYGVWSSSKNKKIYSVIDEL